MSFKRKILMSLAAVTLPVSTGLFIVGAGSASAVTKYDNHLDTVTCGSIVLGKITIAPPLNLTGGSSTTIHVSGKMFGCTDGNGALEAKNAAGADFEGVFAGTLAGSSNSVTSLSGCSATTGNIAISWLAVATGSPTEALAWPHTTLTVDHVFGGTFNPDTISPFGTDNMSTDGYGGFSIGKDALTSGGDGGNCATSASYAAGTQGFMGGDSGGTSSFFGDTQQDFSMFLEGQENSATASTIGLANGEAFFG